MSKHYFLYLLECSNGAYYTGITIDPAKRWSEHLRGKASKYTRSFVPQKMSALFEIHGDRALAQQIESRVKALSRDDKEKIIGESELLKIWTANWLEEADLIYPVDIPIIYKN